MTIGPGVIFESEETQYHALMTDRADIIAERYVQLISYLIHNGCEEPDVEITYRDYFIDSLASVINKLSPLRYTDEAPEWLDS
jgi:hypothetical protein